MGPDDDEFDLRPGRIGKDRKAVRQSQRFVGQVSRAIQKAGGRRPATRGARSGGGPGARGRGARLRALGSDRLQVIVKTRIVRHSGSRYRAAPLARHIRYLEREGVTRDGAPAHMFDADSDRADVRGFAARCEDDRHHFRFIVSPEDAGQLADLRAFTRDLMRQAETDLGTRLDWVAVDHWNTDNPHIHVLVRGRADDGADLVIDGDYLTRGLRERAKDLVTLELGPRSAREIEASLLREVSAERWTSLDAALRGLAGPEPCRVDLRPGGPPLEPALRNALLGRAQTLERLGMAQPLEPACWSLATDLQARLRDLGTRGDIIKTLHKAMSRDGATPDPARFALQPETPSDPIVGRLVARGLHDELSGAAYAVIEGVDGRSHHVRFADLEDTGDARPGAVVELRVWTDRQDRTRTSLAVRSDLSLEAQITADGATWLDRQLVSKAPLQTADGFRAALREALEARTAYLVDAGLAQRAGDRVTYARGLLETLRREELARTRTALAAATGLSPQVPEDGDAVAGIYRRRLDLASGRFAMIDDGLGFSLVPWRPALEAHLGRHVSGAMGARSQVAWSFERARGLGL